MHAYDGPYVSQAGKTACFRGNRYAGYSMAVLGPIAWMHAGVSRAMLGQPVSPSRYTWSRGALGGSSMGFSASACYNRLRWHLLLRPLGTTVLSKGTVVPVGNVRSTIVAVSFRLFSDCCNWLMDATGITQLPALLDRHYHPIAIFSWQTISIRLLRCQGKLIGKSCRSGY